MLFNNKLSKGTLIKIINNGPYTLEKYAHKYLLVKEIVFNKYNKTDPGLYNDVYYLDKKTNKLKLSKENDIFVNFFWGTYLLKGRLNPEIVDQLGVESIGKEELPFKY